MIRVVDYANLGEESRYIELAAERLGLDGADVVVSRNDALLNRMEFGSGQIDALLYKAQTPAPVYNLCLRSNPYRSLPLILCHETIHLSQYMRGDLSVDLDARTFYWKGREYPSDYDYESRPWEVEAFFAESSLYYDCRKEFNAGRRGCFPFRKK